MSSGAPQPIAPGAAGQLAALAAAFAGALLATSLACALLWWRRHRGGAEPGPAAAAGAPTGADPDRLPARALFLGAAVAVLLLWPTAAAVRQLWPHPALGWRLLGWWLLGATTLVVAWLALARLAAGERRDA
ncbi:MAG TPA: hypothetical protein PLL30_02270 [Candidatus Krumholzibacteria bacterium]|nr:hypothetical protein [Candidatus Krumholzibacteria bacterium]HPD70593.1 hypothetical protein [Candidatus Krumholzibacteria bacterium]HRY39707.1 hypothetical protein [Candidatus Krumholzibacteria bacterium]